MTPGASQISRTNRGHAVVIGGSMAGMVAARVLGDHFEHVTLIDRDRFPEEPGYRKGVPQSIHIHALLAKGLELLDQFFPGLKTDLVSAGAVNVHWPRDVYWLLASGWSKRFYHPGFEVLGMSRDLVEWTVRRHVQALDRVEIVEGRNVVDLLQDDGTTISGVRHAARNQSKGADIQDLSADLVVDASGRNSQLPRWLERLGYPKPVESVINPFLGYASRYYARPDDSGTDWKVIFLQPKPPNSNRGGVVMPIDGNRWIVTLAGYNGDYPPTDEDGFLAFARDLRTPVLYDAIINAEPLTSIRGYQRTENRFRHYNRMELAPERLIVVGDSLCAFNPIYGQGMTIAAAEAVVLDQCLKELGTRGVTGDLTGLASSFYQRISPIVDNGWLLATSEDLRFPGTEGASPGLRTRLMHRYIDRLLRVAAQDAEVNRAFANVVNLVAAPRSLFRPGIIWRVAKGAGAPLDDTAAPPEPVPADALQPAETTN